MKPRARLKTGLALTLLAWTALSASASAAENFYDGKTITLLIGSSPGGGYDTYGRLLAQYLGAYIPGKPTIVAKNMSGGGGMKVLSYAYNAAAQDGTVIFTLHQGLPMYQRTGRHGQQYDTRKIHSIGRLTDGNEAVFADPRTGVKSYKDAYRRQIVVGGTGAESDSVVYPTLARNLLGMKFKVIPGYPGTSQIRLAMQAGEVQATVMTLASMYASAPQLLKPGAIVPLVQFGTRRAKEWAAAPTALELAKSDNVRQVFEIVSSTSELGRSYWVAPGVPANRVQLLRTAFNAMTKDAALLRQAKKQKLLLRFGSGEEMDSYVARIFKVQDSAIEILSAAMPKGH